MNIRKILFSLSLLMALALQGNAQKVGFTNIELLMAYMPEVQAIEKELATLEKKLQEGIEVKQRYFQQQYTEYLELKQANRLSPAQDQEWQVKLGKLQEEINTAIQQAQERLFKKRMELMNPLTTKIQNAIDEVAKEGGYNFILNQSMGGGMPSIIYGEEQYDLTEKIAKKLGISVPEE